MKRWWWFPLLVLSCEVTSRPTEVNITVDDVVGTFQLDRMLCNNDGITYEFDGLTKTIAISANEVNVRTTTSDCTKTAVDYSYDLGYGSLAVAQGSSTCSPASCTLSYTLDPLGTQETNCEAQSNESDLKIVILEDEVWEVQEDCTLYYQRTSNQDPGSDPF